MKFKIKKINKTVCFILLISLCFSILPVETDSVNSESNKEKIHPIFLQPALAQEAVDKGISGNQPAFEITRDKETILIDKTEENLFGDW